MAAMTRLYHGSDAAVARPEASRNTGFADLGRGFYLTESREVAANRARSRARATRSQVGCVSAYDFDEGALRWATWGKGSPVMEGGAQSPGRGFGLRFAPDEAGFAAWMEYIRSCRRGLCAAGGLGEPAAVRAWIATDEVEMACSGFVPPADLAPFVDPAGLTVQYCLRDQALIDRALSFAGAETVPAG